MAYIPPQSSDAGFIVGRLLKIPSPLSTDFDVRRIAGAYIKDFKDLSICIRVKHEESKNLNSLIRKIDIAETSFSVEIVPYIAYIIHQVFTKGSYIYAASGTGISIFDLTGSLLYNKITEGKVIKTIWGNDTTLFFGGQIGLYKIEYETLHNDYENSIPEEFHLPTSNIKYIHGKNDSLLVCTDNTIEYFNWGTNPFIRSKTNIENVTKCFLTNNSAYYINNTTISGITTYILNKKTNLLTDWETPTKTYITGDSIFASNIYLTDIFITEQTAIFGGNTIFCTTTSGVYVIDENSLEYAIYYSE